MTTGVFVGRVRSVVLLLSFSVLTATLFWFVWFWRFDGELHQYEGTGRRSWKRRWFFLVVPFVGWFVAVLLAGRQLRRLQIAAGVERLNVPIHAALWAGLVPVLGWLLAAGALQAGGNRLWLRVQTVFEVDAKQERSLQCPQCEKSFAAFLNPLLVERLQCPHCGRASAT